MPNFRLQVDVTVQSDGFTYELRVRPNTTPDEVLTMLRGVVDTMQEDRSRDALRGQDGQGLSTWRGDEGEYGDGVCG